jgi:hypothetical protein
MEYKIKVKKWKTFSVVEHLTFVFYFLEFWLNGFFLASKYIFTYFVENNLKSTYSPGILILCLTCIV